GLRAGAHNSPASIGQAVPGIIVQKGLQFALHGLFQQVTCPTPEQFGKGILDLDCWLCCTVIRIVSQGVSFSVGVVGGTAIPTGYAACFNLAYTPLSIISLC